MSALSIIKSLARAERIASVVAGLRTVFVIRANGDNNSLCNVCLGLQ